VEGSCISGLCCAIVACKDDNELSHQYGISIRVIPALLHFYCLSYIVIRTVIPLSWPSLVSFVCEEIRILEYWSSVVFLDTQKLAQDLV
jgi:hypothetical protein